MRTSFDMLSTNYLKKNNEDETTNEQRGKTTKDNNNQKLKKNHKNIIETVKRPRDKLI
jgi:hypothetical protein